MAMLATAQRRKFDTPDESRAFPKGRSDLVHLDGVTIARLTFEPGWRWSEHLMPTVGTSSCQVAHTIVMLSGRLRTRMDDGAEFELGAGEAASIPPGHDGWVVGSEQVVAYDFTGGEDYAKRR